jgi:hypothetical protein
MRTIAAKIVKKIFFPRKLCHLKDMETYGIDGEATDENVTWHMRFACWITKATHALKICTIYCFTKPAKVMRMRLNVTSVKCTLFIFFISTKYFGNTVPPIGEISLVKL